MDKNPSMLRATLIGGGVFGVLGAIPVVNWINCACCALVVGGGFLAAFLYSKECTQSGAPFTPGNGALVGLVAGLFYALAGTVVGSVFRVAMGPPDIDQMMEMFDQFDVPPETADQIVSFMENSGGVLGIVIGFFASLLIAAIFSTLGGLIGGAVFKVEPAAPSGPPMGSSGGGFTPPDAGPPPPPPANPVS